jgi:TRAP-type C4-dicarboxylate transport system substrate-binding protein
MRQFTRRAALSAVAVAASALAFTGPASAQTVELRASHQWKQGTDARDRALRILVDEAVKRSPDLKVRIYPGLSLNIKTVAQYDALQSGNLDMAIYPLVYATGKIPEYSITILPGSVRNLAEAAKLKKSAFRDKLQALANKDGVHILTWWWTPGGFASKSREIGGPDTVKGLSMRAADPIYEVMLRSSGASIQSMPSSEVYSAMQSGVLDSLLTSAETFVSMRLYEQAKNITIGGDYTMFLLLQPVLVSKKTWDKLTPAQREALEAGAAASEKFFDGVQEEAVKAAEAAFKKAGAKVRPLSKSEYEAWVELAKKTSWPEFENKSPAAKELLKQLLADLGR